MPDRIAFNETKRRVSYVGAEIYNFKAFYILIIYNSRLENIICDYDFGFKPA